MPVLTRRAALAQKSILNVLPNELTTEIISLCDSRSQATLCRVSKHFQQLAYRRLYQIVYVDRDQQVIALEATLSANLQYGAWVRNLAIMGSRAGQDIITSILRSSTKLRELTVWWADAPDWKELSLPELSILKLGGIAHTDIITAFLNRHPKISHLAVPQYRSVHQSRRTLRVDLPSLTVFEGDLNTLGNSPKLRAVRHKLVALEDLDVLERFPTCQDIHLLVLSTVQHRVKDILKRLPLPNLKSCMLMDFHCIYSVNTKSSALKSILADDFPWLRQLESFSMIVHLDRELSERDSIIVESWLRTCPRLQECALLESESWLGSTGRYKIVDGTVQPTSELCRTEMIFRSAFGF